MAQTVKCLPTMPETWVQFLGQEDSLKKIMATHSNILAWKSHGQRSLEAIAHGVARVGHDLATKLPTTTTTTAK